MENTQQETQTTPQPLSPEEEAYLEREFQGLLDDYAHTRNGDKVDLIRRVYAFARRAHAGTRRLSGVPYIYHPLAVARIVCAEIGMGSTSISAALLHDVMKESDVTIEQIETEFGSHIATLVRGLSKISSGNVRFFADADGDFRQPSIKNPDEQAENFRNLLLTMSEDVRVILVKIADRLHNMRTLEALAPTKQRRIASETLYLYAPLAYRLGLYTIKTELEDLSLRYEHPADYAELRQKLQESEESRDRLFTTFAAPIRSMLDGLGLKYTFTSRMKSLYSIWRKMQTKHVPFEEVYDLFATRIVFVPSSPESEKTDCWRIYTAITSVYKIHPDRIRDWISRPKQNGYEALHVTVMGPDGNWIEVQIRSERMNSIAERGLAAHWKYKRGMAVPEVDNELDKWVKTIKDILDNPAPNATEFLNTVKLNLLSSEIYVFTPGGDLQELPKGATALDFAFALHTVHAEAARVNHQIVPISTELHNGQQVEIITAEHETIVEQWREWAVTSKARGRIQAYFNKQRQQVAARGEAMLRDYFAPLDISLDITTMNALLGHFGMQKWDELFYAFGSGELKVGDNLRKVVKPRKPNAILGFFGIGKKKKSEDKPNNEAAAEKAKKQRSAKADKLRQAQGEQPQPHPSTTIELTGIDSRGLLNTITRIISESCTAGIINIHLEVKDGVFRGFITLDTSDTTQVNALCASLKKLHEIQRAVRRN